MPEVVKSRCRRFRDHAELSLIAYPLEIMLVATMLVVAIPMAATGKPSPLSLMGAFPGWFQQLWAWAGLLVAGFMIFGMHTRRTLLVAACTGIVGTMYIAHVAVAGLLTVKMPGDWWYPTSWYATVVVMAWWRASILSRQTSKHGKLAGVKPLTSAGMR